MERRPAVSGQAGSADGTSILSAPHVRWSPIVGRPHFAWPNGARLAVCVLVHLEHLEWLPPKSAVIAASAVHRGPYPDIPDIHETSPHEYANRVGAFRVFDLLDELKIPATVPMDTIVADHYPYLVDQCLSRRWEIIGHGASASQTISQALAEDAERKIISGNVAAIERATGRRPRGWAGVEYAQSIRTVALLAEAGLDYVCDWPNDEQPYELAGTDRAMTVLPVSVHLDDVYAHRMRGVTMESLSNAIIAASDRLVRDGGDRARTLVLGIHPWISGQPFRIGFLRSALAHLAATDGVWFATGSTIVDSFRETSRADGRTRRRGT
jgi:peptidoglycan/xylan/chitin deacetylase (PgdA/CDA1 family)